MKPCVLSKQNPVKIRVILYWDSIRLVGKTLLLQQHLIHFLCSKRKHKVFHIAYFNVYVRQRNYFNLGRECSNQSFIPTAHYKIWSLL